MIELDGKYVLRGSRQPVRLLCIDRPHRYPVIGLVGHQIMAWGKDGASAHDMAKLDLVSPDLPKLQAYEGDVA